MSDRRHALPCPAQDEGPHCFIEHDVKGKYLQLMSLDGTIWVHKFCCHCGEKFAIEIKATHPVEARHGPFAGTGLPPAA
jgi:hypothetical protein